MKQEKLLKKPLRIYLTKFLFGLILLLLCQNGFAQIDPDSTDFIPPINYKLKLAGSFAELRTNHFHAGIDIKSKDGTGGEDIIAAEEGFISRIKIQSGGYGRALYMDHPNGYTTVYAHLEEFEKSLEDFIENVQVSVEQFEVDVYLPPGKFTFNQGEKIGVLGNTGRSYAPHLHFEIRETSSERPMMPSLFNIKVEDNIPPVIKEVYVYELDEYGNPIDKKKVGHTGEKGNYSLRSSYVDVSSNKVGIGVNTYDRADGVWNKNGVYALRIEKGDSSIFETKFDKISFSESKAINAIIDYKHFKSSKSRILKLFNTECNPLSNYNVKNENGWINLEDGKSGEYKVFVEDGSGNESSFNIAFDLTPSDEKIEKPGFHIQCGTIDTVNLSSRTKVIFFENTLYNDQHIEIKEEGNGLDYNISIKNENSPAHRAFKLNIPNIQDPEIIIVKLENGGLVNFGGQIEGENFIAYLDEFGHYYLTKDEVAPTITRQSTVTKGGFKVYRFHISDNLDYDSSLGDYGINVISEGQWVPFDYDLKNDVVIVDSQYIPSGSNSFSVNVVDHSGNSKNLRVKL